MLEKIKSYRHNRSIKRLHKQGVKNMVRAYDLFHHSQYVANKY